jgi:hypothetical protein
MTRLERPASYEHVAVLATGVLAWMLAGTASAGPVLPDFSPSNFTPGAPINNPYFPLTPGTTYRAEADVVSDSDSGERVHAVDIDMVTFRTQTIAGVKAVVVPRPVARTAC